MLARIGREAGMPELFATLARLPGTDLRSLMLHLARAQSAQRSPAELLHQHADDRTVAAGDVDGRRVREIERQALLAAGFAARELSPVSPLGLQTVLGEIDQMSVLATVRGTEVLADPTTELALEAAMARRAGEAEVRLCAVGRVLRMQPLPAGREAHFALFSMVTAGRAGSWRAFELAALREQVAVHLRLLAEAAPGRATAVAVSDASAPLFALERNLVAPLRDEFPKTQIALRPERVDGAAYYRGLDGGHRTCPPRRDDPLGRRRRCHGLDRAAPLRPEGADGLQADRRRASDPGGGIGLSVERRSLRQIPACASPAAHLQ